MVEKIKLLLSYLVMLLKLIVGNKGNRYVLLNSPEHGNLGDHAISLAEIQLFEKYNMNYVELSGGFCRLFFAFLKRNVKETDCICVTGGGFLGSLWKNEDLFVQKIIASFPNNRIIIFPQTLFFSSEDGQYITHFLGTFRQHGNIVFFHREKESFQVGNDVFRDTAIKNILVPDMVLFYNRKYPRREIKKSKKIMFCFRDDKECVTSIEWKNNAFAYLVNSGYEVEECSTVQDGVISFFSREKEVDIFIHKIAESSLVITDRLHGMLFSVVAGTPCISLDNISGKVGSVWNTWLYECEYVRFLKDGFSFSPQLIDTMLKMDIQDYELNIADRYVDVLLAYLKSYIE